jgi:hypothetical protein
MRWMPSAPTSPRSWRGWPDPAHLVIASEAKQSSRAEEPLDCFVATLLAMTMSELHPPPAAFPFTDENEPRLAPSQRKSNIDPTNGRARILYSFSVSSGTILNRSPTRPTSATWKMGASSSLLMATMTFESFIPARCWIAPDMPIAI